MATGFAPKIDDIGVPNATGFSQGTGPNKTFATLFEGITDTAKNVINVKDTQTQLNIQDDAQKAYDQVNGEFGLNPPDSSTPAGMSADLQRMQDLQSAADQGKISQINYYGRLATLSKQLRSKYPGYEHIVDATIQNVTGTRPANAYREAIWSQISQLQSEASSEAKFRRQYEKENAGMLDTLYGPDYWSNPDKYDFQKVQADVGKLKGTAYQIQSQKDQLGLIKDQNEVNTIQSQKTFDQEAAFTVQTGMNKALGLNGPKPYDQINQFVAKGGGSPEELNQFIGNVSMLEGQMRAELTAKSQEYVAKGWLSRDAANKSIDAALFPITKAKEAVLGGDFKLAARYATISKTLEDQQQSEMLKDPTVLAGSGLSKISQTLGDTYLQTNINAVQTAAEEAAGRVLNGTPGTAKAVIESGNQKVAREYLSQNFRVLVDPKVQGQDLSNVVNQTFGPDAPDYMSPKVVSSDDLEKLFLQFTRPEVTKAIAQKGSKEDLATYTKWALEKAQSIPSIRAAAGNVNSNFGAVASDVNIQFDPQNYKLLMSTPGFTTADQREGLGRTLDAMNKVLTVMKPIFEANGDKEGLKMAKDFIGNMNIQLGGDNGPHKSVLQKIWDAIPSDLTQSVGEVLQDKKSENQIQPVSDGQDQIDFASTNSIRGTNPSTTSDEHTNQLLDMIGRSEGAGYNTIYGYNEQSYNVVPTKMTVGEIQDLQSQMAKDLGSSAVGKYQIMKGTLRDAIKDLGISKDEMFTPELQDRIAKDYLLKRRGYEDYRSGSLSGKEFLNNLAQEWASVPTSSGASFYAGDRMGNKATKAGRKLADMFG